jgi:HEAT repeat protein
MLGLQSLLIEITSGDDDRAQKALQPLIKFGEDAISELGKLLTDSSADNRWWAIRALVEFSEVDITDYLLQGLEDSDIAVQQCAALALRQRPDSYAIPELIDLLDHHDRLLARLAADALTAIGKRSTQSLITVIEKGTQAARLEAVRSLAAICDQEAVSIFYKLLEDDSQIIQYWAEEGLKNLGLGMAFFLPT